MRHQPDISPPSKRNHYYCLGSKNWSRPPTHLNARSPSRIKPYHRAANVHVTKTSPFRPSPPNAASQPKPPYLPRAHLHTSWGLRRPQSDTAPKDSSILLYRPSWVDNLSPSVRPLPYIPSLNYILCYNRRRFPSI